MKYSRESKHFDGRCAVPAEFLFTGPSGMSNPLCGYHMKIVLKKWTFHAGFTIETVLTLTPSRHNKGWRSAGFLSVSNTQGSPSARNLNDGKE